ncbi:hypothetical protein RJ640_021078 [Escallonia rubra]|uniref:GAG-pre-integrase domain-containing protein n=1 Tax=Escallonia rubra TaxID=112253 RepID=A0AA88QST9_9ASTE|nr:hypothetical protein RJ640_021078 [Escallonia rubra]
MPSYASPRSPSQPAAIVTDNAVSAAPSSSTPTMELTVDELVVISNYRLSQTGNSSGIYASSFLSSYACSVASDTKPWDAQTRKVVGTGRKVDLLFVLDHLHMSSTSVAAASTSSKALQLWHSRLGHASLSRLRPLVSSGQFGSISVSDFHYLSCQFSKQSKLPSNNSDSRASQIFDLVHSDRIRISRHVTFWEDTLFVHVSSLDTKSSTSSLKIPACSIDPFPDTTTSLPTPTPADAIDPLAPGPNFPSTSASDTAPPSPPPAPQGTLSHGLHYPSASSLQLTTYSDADWGRDLVDHRSTTGFCFFLGNSLISWRSKKQSIVSRSSTESEYRALADTAAELVWLRWLLGDMGVSFDSATPIHCHGVTPAAGIDGLITGTRFTMENASLRRAARLIN